MKGHAISFLLGAAVASAVWLIIIMGIERQWLDVLMNLGG
jgi:hypothetical protein